jgi:hypothetical protein
MAEQEPASRDGEVSWPRGQAAETVAETARLRAQNEALGLAVYDLQGGLVTAAGPAGVFAALPRGPLDKAIKQGADSSDLWTPGQSAVAGGGDLLLHVDGRMAGALVILEDANSIRARA